MAKVINKRSGRIVNAPEVRPADNPGDVLINWYKDLGWDPRTSTLNPVKIRAGKATFDELLDVISESAGGYSLETGMLMVNSGPGVDDNLPAGQVRLLDGWHVEDVN